MTWISDKWDEPKGRALKIKVNKLLDSVDSKFQKIEIYDSKCFGKVLVLDGVIHSTEFDETSYHEMLVHVPMHCHPNPKKALVIGGGDGGCVREILKHESIVEVHLCEIDKAVIDICKKNIPQLSSKLDDEKVKIFYEDGSKFIKERKEYYDIIIVDSSDPIGPAEVLFTKEFYKDMHDALTEKGIISTQSESMFYDLNLIKKMIKFNEEIFPIVKYYYCLIPTYPSGTIGFSFCSKKIKPDEFRKSNIKTKYYNSEIHRASFVLPEFVK